MATTAYPVLRGPRVIEFPAFVAAPLGGLTLAQLGPDVIRVDPIGGNIDIGRWPLNPSYQRHEFTYVKESGGKLIGRAIPTIGNRGMHSFDLAFGSFFVPDANVVGWQGGLGQGFYLTMAGMVGGRMQTAARALGMMPAPLNAANQYSKDGKALNAPPIASPFTQIKIAQTAARFAACRQLAYTVGRRFDSGEARMEASLVELLACRSAELVTRAAQQIHGGMGYAEDTPVSRYFVDARVLSIFKGAEETLAPKVVTKSLLESTLAQPCKSQ